MADRLTFKKNGVRHESLMCKYRWRNGTKDDLIAEFKDSRVFAGHAEKHQHFAVCNEVKGTMIRDCTKPAAGNDCCHRYCFQITHLLRGLEKVYESKDSLSKDYNRDSYKAGSVTHMTMLNMSEFRAACCQCRKVQNGTELPSDKESSVNYKLNC